MTSLLIVPPQLVAKFSCELPVTVMVDIVYRRPDCQHLLQQYTQDMSDIMPFLPKVSSFLVFWMEKIDGPIVTARLGIRGPEGNNLAQYTIPKQLLN